MIEIPPLDREIEDVYVSLMARKVQTVAITSANPKEGVTSVAVALAQRHLLAGRSTLLVDLNLHNPSLDRQLELADLPRLLGLREGGLLPPPQLVGVENQGIALTGVTAPKGREAIIKLRNPGVLEEYIAVWLQVFDSVIFDTSPINVASTEHIPPERVAAACDGSLLVVLSGRTTEAMAVTAIDRLKSSNAVLLGCLYNDRDNPSLQQELLREVDRLPSFLGWISKRISRRIKKNRLLSLDV